MKCPFCGYVESKVMDSRVSRDGSAIRRRRECLACSRRFTTYEYIEEILPTVVKKDGRREPFDRSKIRNGIRKACQKRPISMETIESLVVEVERFCQDYSGEEIRSSMIGEKIIILNFIFSFKSFTVSFPSLCLKSPVSIKKPLNLLPTAA